MSLLLFAVAMALLPQSKLPLGDGKVSSGPQHGFIFACETQFPGGGGAQRSGDWIKDGFWYPDEKPIVEVHVEWPNSTITISIEGDTRVVRANNLPKHATGEFPIRPGTKAYEYDRNPNHIGEQQILLKLPAHPTLAAQPSCVPMGMIGFALSGAAIFNGFDLQGHDAPAHEIQDGCNVHPEMSSQYHYHDWSPCMPDPDGNAGRHSSLAGYMLDGFPIFGPKGDGGEPLTDADLDAYHGHTGEVMIDGKKVTMYHYHFTIEYPYTVGCFAGSVDLQLLRRRPSPNGHFPPPPPLAAR